jgi:hypothetical protein
MSPRLVAILLVIGALFGCGHTIPVGIDNHPNQWVLESYVATKGYTFIKDGIRYQTHCNYAGIERNDGTDPPGAATQESDCSIILPYLHKPIPLEMGAHELHYDDILVFKEPHPDSAKGIDNWRVSFVILEAK